MYKYPYELNQTQRKELFAVALSFAQIFLDNNPDAIKDSNFTEYWDFIRANKDIKTEQGAIDSINSVYEILNELTDGEDVDVHPLLLSVNAILYIWESGYYKGSKAMKGLRVANTLYFKIEDNTDTPRLKRTNKLMGELINRYGTML